MSNLNMLVKAFLPPPAASSALNGAAGWTLLTDVQLTSKSYFYRPRISPKYSFIQPGECVRIPWVLALKNCPVENFQVYSVLPKKFTFLPISVSRRKKNVAGSCALNFDATNLPHS